MIYLIVCFICLVTGFAVYDESNEAQRIWIYGQRLVFQSSIAVFIYLRSPIESIHPAASILLLFFTIFFCYFVFARGRFNIDNIVKNSTVALLLAVLVALLSFFLALWLRVVLLIYLSKTFFLITLYIYFWIPAASVKKFVDTKLQNYKFINYQKIQMKPKNSC